MVLPNTDLSNMDLPKETLFPDESAGSLDFKMVRLAREFRRVLITQPLAHITVVGTIRPSRLRFLDDGQIDELIKSLVARFVAARDRLIAFGVSEQSVFGYLPVSQGSGPDDVIVAAAQLGRTPTVNELGPQFGPRTRIASAADVIADDHDDFIQGQIVIDPFAKADDPSDRPSHVETQIEITVWDRKPVNGGRIVFLKTLKVTLNVTPDRIDQIGAELSVVTLRVRQIVRHFRNAQVSVKVSPQASVDLSTAARIKSWADSQVKLSLEVEFHGIQIEPAIGLDLQGKPAFGVELTFPLPFDL